ncbi:MAG: HupE/UreJ family protein [Myxococcota bacterium]
MATALLAATAAPASAHLGSTTQFAIEVRTEENARTIDVASSLEATDVGLALGLGLDPSEGRLLAHEVPLRLWLTETIRVTAGQMPCAAEPGPIDVGERDAERTVEVRTRFQCPSRGAVVFRNDAVFDDDPDHTSLVHITRDDTEELALLRANQREVVLTKRSTTVAVAGRFVREGVLHLFGGLDHVLFLLSLLLGAGFIASRDGYRRSLLGLAAIVTAFTVGHSVSLVASTLGWLNLPSTFVEASIAASIIVVCVANVWKPGAHRARPSLALGFGVLHGFGFASVLADLGLPPADQAVAVLSFNVGIELGQLLLVALFLLPLAYLGRHETRQRVVLYSGSAAVSLIALFWLFERVGVLSL